VVDVDRVVVVRGCVVVVVDRVVVVEVRDVVVVVPVVLALVDVVTEVEVLRAKITATTAADEGVAVAEPRFGASPKGKRVPFCSASQ
jgi:hypothetical protein